MAVTLTQCKSILYTDRNGLTPVLVQGNDRYSITKIDENAGSAPSCRGFTIQDRLYTKTNDIYLQPDWVQWFDPSLDGDTNPMFSPLSLEPEFWFSLDGTVNLQTGTTINSILDQSGNQNSDLDALYLLDYPTINLLDSGFNYHTTVSVTFEKLLKLTGAVNIAAPYTIFFVGSFGTAHGADTYQQMVFSNDTSDVIFGKKVADSKIYLGTLAGPVAASGCLLAVGVVNGGSSKVYMNSKTAAATGASTTAALTNVSFGGEEAGANALQGKIAQAMVVSGAVSNANIGYWMDIMSSRYAVTLT